MQWDVEFQEYINLSYILISGISLQGPHKIMIYNEKFKLGMMMKSLSEVKFDVPLKQLKLAAPCNLFSSRLTCACVWTAAFPGESGVSGAGGRQREAAVGGDAHGQSGSHAERPPPPGPGELHHRAAGCPPSGRSPSQQPEGPRALGTQGHEKEVWRNAMSTIV